MPEVTLRAYTREIDELIEREQLEEAIAHCRHILQTYPKHLETYRHLGKAYLEAKRYGDAADIFQRVLSAVPDDFVSHIGMAIVREDEGNLDAAIWHMERAFETNPSNPAIQQEMKRLIARRDGLEPHKVRLTRGALARMYSHGELYTQAIAELRSALQEDPDRPDLQVLLAEMYWQTDQRSEATSVANRVLEKLPYCMQANRIMAANLQAKNRVEEAALHHRRLAGLDPYAAFVEAATADPATIEESAVSLERFEWQPGAPMPDGGISQPGWAATLGMEMKQSSGKGEARKSEVPQTGPLPSWLEPGEPPPFEARDEDDDDQEPSMELEPEQEPDSADPDWLSEETEMKGEAEELEPSESEEDFMRELGESGEIPPEPSDVEPDESAEIPDWMQEAGWTESTGEAVEQPVSFSDAELRSLEAGEIPPDSPPPDDEDAELAPADLPDWMQGMAPEPGDEPDSDEAPQDSGPPDWLADGDDEEDVELDAAGAAGLVADEPPSQPPALGGGQTAEPADEPAPDFPAAESADEPSFPAAERGTEDLPTWITEDAPGATDTIVTWLGGQDRAREEDSEDEHDELPEWMKDTGPLVDKGDGGIGIPSPTDELEAVPAAPDDDEDAPDWMEGILDSDEEEAPPSDEEPIAAADRQPEPAGQPASDDDGPDLPGWLSAVAEVAAAGDTPTAGEPADGFEPDEFEGPETPAASFEATLPEAPVGEPVSEPTAEVPSAADRDQVEAVPDQDEEAELTPAEPPDWLSEAMGEPPSSVDEDDLVAASMEPEAELADVEPPSWMDEDEPVQQPEPTPDEDAMTDQGATGETPDMEPTVADQGTAGETPDWLKSLADEGTEQTAAERAADAPDWLREIAEPETQMASSDGEPVEDLPQSPTAEVPDSAAAETADAPSAEVGEIDSARQSEPAGIPSESVDVPPQHAADAQEDGEQAGFPAAETVSPDMETPPHGFAPPDWLQAADDSEAAKSPSTESETGPESAESPPPELAETASAAPEPASESPAPPQEEPAAPAPEAPDWLSGIGDEVEADSAPDWLSEIGSDPAQPSESEGGPDWLGDIGADSTQTPAAAEGSPDWLGDIGQEGEPTPAAGQAPDWLGELGEADAPPPSAPTEPSIESEAQPSGPTLGDFETPGTPPEDVDDEVISWLEDLAAAQEETEIPDTIHQAPEAAPEAPVMEQREIPEEPEEGLEWLEQLAEQRGLDVDVGLPEATTTKPAAASPPEIAEEPEPPGPEDSAPDWLTRMATQPLPKVDMDAIEAASTQQPMTQPEAEQPAVDPGAETIKKRAEDLQVEMPGPPAEQPELPVEADEVTPEPPAQEPTDEDEMPEWLRQAASQEQAATEPDLTPSAPAAEAAPEPAPEPPEPPEAEIEPAATAPVEPIAAEPTELTPAVEQPPAVPEPAEAMPGEPDIEAPAEPLAAEPEQPAAEPTAEAPAEIPGVPAAEPAAEPPAPEPAAEPAAEPPAPEPAAEQPAEPPAPEPAAAEPAKPKPEQTLDTARQELASGDYEQAIELYTGLIKRKSSLETVIEDLRMAVDRTPDSAALWQTLGDAYMKNDQSAEAIDAYRKGMEVA